MLNLIDGCLTEIMLAWEKFCAKKSWNQQPCSPKQKEVARISSYWKQKHLMAQRKLFHQCHLDQLQKDTSILGGLGETNGDRQKIIATLCAKPSFKKEPTTWPPK